MITEPPPPEAFKYQVVRTYCHTDLKQLWAVMSRPMADKQITQQWCEFVAKEWKVEHPRSDSKFFVVEVLA